MWFYQYCVEYWSDVEEKELRAEGLLRASTYIDAIKQLGKYYGEKEITDILRLRALDAESVLEKEFMEDIEWVD